MNVFNRLFGSSQPTEEERRAVDQLVQMGFPEDAALSALRLPQVQGDVEKAALHIAQQNESEANQPSPAQKAAEAALRRQEQFQLQQPQREKQSQAKKSSKPAATRMVREGDGRDPSVVRAEKIRAAAEQVAGNVKALDAVLFIISRIIQAPEDKRFHSISCNNRVYKETIAKCSPAELLLLLMGFAKQKDKWNTFEFSLQSVDPALLWLGKTALEAQKDGDIYKHAKELAAFEKALKESMSSATKEEERRRASYLSQVPPEPDPQGASSGISKLQVSLADKFFRRNFYSDETLMALVQWLGSISSIVPDKLISGEWELVDKSLYPPKPIQVGTSLELTLQALDWCPSAELLIKPRLE